MEGNATPTPAPEALANKMLGPSLVLHLKILRSYAKHCVQSELIWGPLIGWARHCGDRVIDYVHPTEKCTYLFPVKEGSTCELYPLAEAPAAMFKRTCNLLRSMNMWVHQTSVQGLGQHLVVQGSTLYDRNILARKNGTMGQHVQCLPSGTTLSLWCDEILRSRTLLDICDPAELPRGEDHLFLPTINKNVAVFLQTKGQFWWWGLNDLSPPRRSRWYIFGIAFIYRTTLN